MSNAQIREIVRITIDELMSRNLIKTNLSYPQVLKIIEKKINDFFNNHGDGNGISHALHYLSDDPYIDIIFLHYRDGKTIAWIAEFLEKDESTIKRNKKRLIMSIYDLLEE